MMPEVSVVIPVHNGGDQLRDAVASVRAQSLRELELIVVDDGSTDGTGELLAELAAADDRVRPLDQPRSGRVAALSRGIAAARSPLIARLDADDVALPGRLESQRTFLAANPAVAVVGGGVVFTDAGLEPFAEVGYPLTDAEIRHVLPQTTPLAHPAVMFRRAAIEQAGGYRALFRVAEDTDLWLRVAEQAQLANLPEMVIRYRIHSRQDSVQMRELAAYEALAARLAARARAAGRPDPLVGAERVDRRLLLELGATVEEINAAVVQDYTWMARTLDRAGQPGAAARLFAAAEERARSAGGSPRLRATVLAARAERAAAAGRRLRAAADRIRAARLRRR